ncbi:MAG: glycosyltransferase [Flavobacteriales bacterium]|nr:glycosyltransferase [Flavobacteriales bacterium]MBP7154690.1 glycosyltransferase [Flavobacteriales bacterium]
MKLVLISAGNSIHTMRWANAFVLRGLDVHLITQHKPLAGFSKTVGIHPVPHLFGLGYLLNGLRVKKLIAELDPDVVNVHYASGYGSFVRWCAPEPTVLNVWGSDVFAFPEKSTLHKRWLLRNMRSASRIVSTSKSMARRVASLIGQTVPVAVVPFGVDMDMFKPLDPKEDPSVVTIGTVKTLEPHYGVDLLIWAFIRLSALKDLRPIQLRIVGGGGELQRLRAMVEQAGLMGRVEFVGPVPHDQVPSELHKLDVYVALSREESFGVAVVEAQACGLPVVVSDVGGLPEVVQDMSTGFIVPSDDIKAATVALEKLVRDHGSRRRMGTSARHFVVQNYEWETCVDRMLAVFNEVSSEQHR